MAERSALERRTRERQTAQGVKKLKPLTRPKELRQQVIEHLGIHRTAHEMVEAGYMATNGNIFVPQQGDDKRCAELRKYRSLSPSQARALSSPSPSKRTSFPSSGAGLREGVFSSAPPKTISHSSSKSGAGRSQSYKTNSVERRKSLPAKLLVTKKRRNTSQYEIRNLCRIVKRSTLNPCFRMNIATCSLTP